MKVKKCQQICFRKNTYIEKTSKSCSTSLKPSIVLLFFNIDFSLLTIILAHQQNLKQLKKCHTFSENTKEDKVNSVHHEKYAHFGGVYQ
jgi:hypothetical protein